MVYIYIIQSKKNSKWYADSDDNDGNAPQNTTLRKL
jgi:hypothetical protein